MISGSTTNSASDGIVKMMLAVIVVNRRSAVVRWISAPSGTAISRPEHDRDQRQPQVNHRQRPGVVEVGEQIAHAQPASGEPSFGKAFGRCAFSAANTSSARTPPIRPAVVVDRHAQPGRATTTPRPAPAAASRPAGTAIRRR